jgi:hypothetical protein
VVAPLPAGGLEAGLLVGTSCLAQDVGGGQEQVVVPGLPGEGDAFGHKEAADSASACVRLQHEQPQRGGPFAVPDARDRSDWPSVQFRNPGPLGLRVMAMQYPAHIAGPGGTDADFCQRIMPRHALTTPPVTGASPASPKN